VTVVAANTPMSPRREMRSIVMSDRLSCFFLAAAFFRDILEI